MPDDGVSLLVLVSSVWAAIIAGLCFCILVDLRANILFTKDVSLEARDYLQENRAVIQEARTWPDQNRSLVQRRGHIVQDGTRPVVQGRCFIAEPCPAYG